MICAVCGIATPTTAKRCRKCGGNTLFYQPDASEIAAACYRIRQMWTEAERNSRIADDRLRRRPVKLAEAPYPKWGKGFA